MINDINHVNSLKYAVNLIQEGNIIIYPTDTIYGFGVDATNSKAINRLNKIKKREQPYSIIVNSINMLKKYSKINNSQEKKIKEYLPGAYTLIFEKNNNDLSELISLGLNTIAVRIPKHNFPCSIVQNFGKPIVTTSVNIHSNKHIDKIEIMEKLFPNINIFIDKNLDNFKNASTILDLTNNNIKILRTG